MQQLRAAFVVSNHCMTMQGSVIRGVSVQRKSSVCTYVHDAGCAPVQWPVTAGGVGQVVSLCTTSPSLRLIACVVVLCACRCPSLDVDTGHHHPV